MSAELVRMPPVRLDARGQSRPPVSWRGLHKALPAELTDYIRQLEQACIDDPESADLRTCLESAYAINYDVCKSMSALEAAKTVDPEKFWNQLKAIVWK